MQDEMLSVVADSAAWDLQAACRGVSADFFVHPLAGEPYDLRRRREAHARRVCEQCPVRQECLAYALRVHEPLGIWGGLSEGERRRVVAGSSDPSPTSAPSQRDSRAMGWRARRASRLR
jgi:WhiB family transcriptional regulator, redox-sensing transcriptional regulator